jgi:hypothetical protein
MPRRIIQKQILSNNNYTKQQRPAQSEIFENLRITFMRSHPPFSALVQFLILLAAVYSSATVVLSSVSQDSLFVGDRVHFGVNILVPKGGQVVPPATDNSFGRFVVKEWASDKSEKKNADSLSFNYILTTYSPECCTIPSLPFLQTINNKTDTLRTNPIPMRVVLVAPSSAKDTAAIRDIKGLERVGTPSLFWLWLVLAFGAVAAAIVLIRRFRKKKTFSAPVVPPKPPYEEAIEALRLLEAKQYIVKGMIREYVFELSDIIKRYIERRFGTNAAEFTTEEMLDWIRISPLDPAMRRALEWFFSTADPVKFAKWTPDSDTTERFGVDMRTFVEQTKPMQPQTGKKQPEAGHAPK